MARRKQMNGTPAETEAAFYDALSRSDVDALMTLWSDDEEIVCIHPGAPRLIGHAAIRSSWEAIFARGRVHIQPIQLHVTLNLMSAIHSVIEEITAIGHASQDVHVVTTNVYIKTPQGWRIVVHHASFAAGHVSGESTQIATLH